MREGVSLTAANHAVLLVVCATVACSSKAGPNDEAVASYLERHGVTTADVVATNSIDGAAVPVAGPPAGRVALTVERATGLPDLDTGPGTTDAYVIIEYEGQRHR